MAFFIAGSLDPRGAPVLKKAILTNSVTSTLLDSVKLATGFVTAGTAAALVFGHVTGHATNFGVGVQSTGAAGASVGSYASAFTTSSTNQTVAKVKAECDVSKHTLYSATLTAASGTTTGSNLMGYKINLSTAVTLDESSTLATTLQYSTWGVDQNVAANIIVNVYQSQVFGV